MSNAKRESKIIRALQRKAFMDNFSKPSVEKKQLPIIVHDKKKIVTTNKRTFIGRRSGPVNIPVLEKKTNSNLIVPKSIVPIVPRPNIKFLENLAIDVKTIKLTE